MESVVVAEDPNGGYTAAFHIDEMPPYAVVTLAATTAAEAIEEAARRWPRIKFRPVEEADEADGDVIALGE
jgi:hypothetical protein